METPAVAIFSAYGAYHALAIWLPILMRERGSAITKSLAVTLVMATAFPIGSGRLN